MGALTQTPIEIEIAVVAKTALACVYDIRTAALRAKPTYISIFTQHCYLPPPSLHV